MTIEVRFICPLCRPAGLCTFQCVPGMPAGDRHELIEVRTFLIGSVMAYCRDKPHATPDQLQDFLALLLSGHMNG